MAKKQGNLFEQVEQAALRQQLDTIARVMHETNELREFGADLGEVDGLLAEYREALEEVAKLDAELDQMTLGQFKENAASLENRRANVNAIRDRIGAEVLLACNRARRQFYVDAQKYLQPSAAKLEKVDRAIYGALLVVLDLAATRIPLQDTSGRLRAVLAKINDDFPEFTSYAGTVAPKTCFQANAPAEAAPLARLYLDHFSLVFQNGPPGDAEAGWSRFTTNWRLL